MYRNLLLEVDANIMFNLKHMMLCCSQPVRREKEGKEMLFRWLIPCCCQLYRLERYDDCLAAYRDLIRNSQDEYEEERKTNLSAVVAAQSTWERVMPVSDLPTC